MPPKLVFDRRLTVDQIRTDPLIKEFIAHGELIVRGAYYSLDTGAVSIVA